MRRYIAVSLLMLFSAAVWYGWTAHAAFSVPDLKEPVLLLWVEEINTHALDPTSFARPLPDPVELIQERRAVRVTRLDRRRGGDGRQLLVVHRVFDHDLLLAVFTDLLAGESLPLDLQLRRAFPTRADGGFAGASLRLLPRSVRIDRVTGEGTVVCIVDGRDVPLGRGETWTWASLAGSAEPVSFRGGFPTDPQRRRDIEQALDAGRPLTMLRVQNLAFWRLETGDAGP